MAIIRLVNDFHGRELFVERLIAEMSRMRPGSILLMNGDMAGSRGPKMNRVADCFYEVRERGADMASLKKAIADIIGEMPEINPEWIFKTVHFGMCRRLMADCYPAFRECMEREIEGVLNDTLRPISAAAKNRNIIVIYIKGNCETTPFDLIPEDITVEKTVEPDKQYYQKLDKEGFFEDLGIEYVSCAKLVCGEVLSLGSSLLDLTDEQIEANLKKEGAFNTDIKSVIVHYPPVIQEVREALPFLWVPNREDYRRAERVGTIIKMLDLPERTRICFGHAHLGINNPRMDTFPSQINIPCMIGKKHYVCTWNRPGAIMTDRILLP